MAIVWGAFSEKSRKWLKTGWLITAGIMALYVGGIEPAARGGGISESSGRPEFQPMQMWQAPFYERIWRSHEMAMAYGAPRAMAKGQIAGFLDTNNQSSTSAVSAAADRKMVRTSSIDLVVNNPADAADKIRQLADYLGGFLETSQTNGAQEASSAALAIRVPAARFEEARAEIRKLGLRVDSERLEAQDATRQYVDQEARLRNLRAQEQQYLSILKHAHTIKDTLEVSDKLNEVRGQIELQQAEFNALAKQTETVAITISLRAESDAQVFGLHWRPLYQLKFAAREGLDSIADYAAAMTAFAFHLPAILLWLGAIMLGAALGWRILRWSARFFFHLPNRAASKEAA